MCGPFLEGGAPSSNPGGAKVKAYFGIVHLDFRRFIVGLGVTCRDSFIIVSGLLLDKRLKKHDFGHRSKTHGNA